MKTFLQESIMKTMKEVRIKKKIELENQYLRAYSDKSRIQEWPAMKKKVKENFVKTSPSI